MPSNCRLSLPLRLEVHVDWLVLSALSEAVFGSSEASTNLGVPAKDPGLSLEQHNQDRPW